MKLKNLLILKRREFKTGIVDVAFIESEIWIDAEEVIWSVNFDLGWGGIEAEVGVVNETQTLEFPFQSKTKKYRKYMIS